jgi:hypothetical protein
MNALKEKLPNCTIYFSNTKVCRRSAALASRGHGKEVVPIVSADSPARNDDLPCQEVADLQQQRSSSASELSMMAAPARSTTRQTNGDETSSHEWVSSSRIEAVRGDARAQDLLVEEMQDEQHAGVGVDAPPDEQHFVRAPESVEREQATVREGPSPAAPLVWTPWTHRGSLLR